MTKNCNPSQDFTQQIALHCVVFLLKKNFSLYNPGFPISVSPTTVKNMKA